MGGPPHGRPSPAALPRPQEALETPSLPGLSTQQRGLPWVSAWGAVGGATPRPTHPWGPLGQAQPEALGPLPPIPGAQRPSPRRRLPGSGAGRHSWEGQGATEAAVTGSPALPTRRPTSNLGTVGVGLVPSMALQAGVQLPSAMHKENLLGPDHPTARSPAGCARGAGLVGLTLEPPLSPRPPRGPSHSGGTFTLRGLDPASPLPHPTLGVNKQGAWKSTTWGPWVCAYMHRLEVPQALPGPSVQVRGKGQDSSLPPGPWLQGMSAPL